MRAKRVTRTARNDIVAISRFILRDNPPAAKRYRDSAFDTFENWPDEVTPKRASERLPDYVRELHVAGFNRYTLRIATFDDVTYLLAAFAPGLPDDLKDGRTRSSLRSL